MKALEKIKALKEYAFELQEFDGYLIFNQANLLYLTGFQGVSSLLIPKNGEPMINVYGVNYEQAKSKGNKFRVELVKPHEKLMSKIAKQTKEFEVKKLAVDTLNIKGWQTLKKEVEKQKITLTANNDFVSNLRKVKSEAEIRLLRKAGELTSQGMRIAIELLSPGIKEQELAGEIEYAMRKKGGYGTAFETVVASGAASAFPHGDQSNKEIQRGDLVVIDIGATYKYYCSDMTRTLVVGNPSKKQKQIHKIVKTAQEKTLKALKPNLKAVDADADARKTIEDAGYEKHFVHSLGHGVGLEVHELPVLSSNSKETLNAGNVVTVEPGIYLVGYGGVRIEDTVLIEIDGVEKLTEAPYDLRPMNK